MGERRAVTKKLATRYKRATRKEKSAVLDELVGLTGWHRDYAGDWTVPMAADRLGTSRQAVQRIANELVDDGVAAFADNPRHRRSPFLRLTDESARVLNAITAQAQCRHQALLSKLDNVDLIEARAVLRHLIAAVRSELET